MFFISTKNAQKSASPSQVIIDGISDDGGLYVPKEFPKVSAQFYNDWRNMGYADIAAQIYKLYLTDFSDEDIEEVCAQSAEMFEDGDPAPLVKIKEGLYILELFHGPTYAFKDLALTVLPRLMVKAKQKLNIKEKIVILVATSGDTGKAALEGFKDVDGTGIIVLYPFEGVSPQQKLQMQTQSGSNVCCIGIHGNFDDAQRAVKEFFANEGQKKLLKDKGIILSSANSINFGRLLPQIVYYFSAYMDLVNAKEIEPGEKVNYVVPCGNFGNILAGYYAYRMGLPVNKLVCASNKNNVLTDFITSGNYNRVRKFYKTISPSMDILVSSNVERLVFELSGRNDKLTAQRMAALNKEGSYNLSEAEKKALTDIFWAGFADDEITSRFIDKYFEEEGYLADPHTAVALKVYEDFREAGFEGKTVLLSTANPYKFAADVLRALGVSGNFDEVSALSKLYEISAMEIPGEIKNVAKKPILHKLTATNDDIKQKISDTIIDKFSSRD